MYLKKIVIWVFTFHSGKLPKASGKLEVSCWMLFNLKEELDFRHLFYQIFWFICYTNLWMKATAQCGIYESLRNLFFVF